MATHDESKWELNLEERKVRESKRKLQGERCNFEGILDTLKPKSLEEVACVVKCGDFIVTVGESQSITVWGSMTLDEAMATLLI